MSSFQFRVNRRRFLTAVTASLGSLALRGYPVLADAAAHFTHGVASGDPLSDRVILWTRVLPGSGQLESIQVSWEVAADEQFRTLVASGSSSTDQQRDYTVKIDAAGLLPARQYYYRFTANGVHSPTGRTRTLADSGQASVRLAVVSCSNYPQGYFHVYKELAVRQFDAVVHLGDYIYEYAEGGYANPEVLAQGRHVEPAHEIITLEDYRLRYGLYRSDPDLQAVHQAHPFICTWDDHEISNNTWIDGAENHNAGEGEFAARRLAAIRAFHEWLPIREQSMLTEGRIYRSFEFGDLASLIMLDTRLIGRDEQLSASMNLDELRAGLADEQRTIMGAAQEQWLENELKRSAQASKPWQIIGQQVLMGKLFVPQIADEEFDPAQRQAILDGRYGLLRERGQQGLALNMDAWDGYPANRERVLNAFREYANNAVVLAGDTHSSWAFDLAAESGEPVAVEFGTPSVTSPGFENFLPIPQDRLQQATLQASPELKYFKADGRGWVELLVNAERVQASYQFVSTVQARDYELVSGARLISLAGEPGLREAP
ncbi:MAG: alkaline phosphatase D family protein [Pseudomonadales bacterium]|nr:alkaline phosphatase D family protein [Pseudomonadales bacterium]